MDGVVRWYCLNSLITRWHKFWVWLSGMYMELCLCYATLVTVKKLDGSKQETILNLKVVRSCIKWIMVINSSYRYVVRLYNIWKFQWFCNCKTIMLPAMVSYWKIDQEFWMSVIPWWAQIFSEVKYLNN